MLKSRFLLLAALGPLTLAAAGASAAPVEGKFRGTYVCEKMATTRNILRVALDLEVNGDNVRFARPLLNLNGARVVGSEMAEGKIDADGHLQLTSSWTLLGNTSNAEYSGALTPSGGTLTGKQTWTGLRGGQPVIRTCTIAVVAADTTTSSQAQQRQGAR